MKTKGADTLRAAAARVAGGAHPPRILAAWPDRAVNVQAARGVLVERFAETRQRGHYVKVAVLWKWPPLWWVNRRAGR